MDIFGFVWMPNWLLLLIILLITYFVYACKEYHTFKSMGVKGPTPFPVIGNILPYFTVGVKKAQDSWYKKYGRVFGIFEMSAPNLFIGDADLVREILVKQFSNFTNRRVVANQSPPLDKLMTVLKDNHWKHVRSTMSPAFSSGKLKRMSSLINDACDTLVDKLIQMAENKEDVEIKETCAKFSVDVIGSVAFGLQIDSQNSPDDPFVVHGKAFFKIRPLVVLALMFFPKLLPLVSKLPSAQKDSAKFFENMVRESFRQRKDDSEKRNDFLQLMVNAAKEAGEAGDDSENNKTGNSDDQGQTKRKGLTFNEIVSQSVIFFIGGMESIASSLAMVLYSLALHTDILEKTLQEIDCVVGKGDSVTYDKANELHYLEQVICETQRMYPTIVRVDRECSTPTTLKGITIPKGMCVSVPIATIHHDEEYWPEPEKFDPDRFHADVKNDINPFTFLPFGHGPRNCIAMRLALLEMKIALARVLKKLRPVKVPRTQEKPEFSKVGFLTINGGAWIGMEKRN